MILEMIQFEHIWSLFGRSAAPVGRSTAPFGVHLTHFGRSVAPFGMYFHHLDVYLSVRACKFVVLRSFSYKSNIMFDKSMEYKILFVHWYSFHDSIYIFKEKNNDVLQLISCKLVLRKLVSYKLVLRKLVL
jgi:hypothetical protein